MAEFGPLSQLQRAQVARMRAQMGFVRSRGGEPGAPKTTDVAAQLLSAAKRLENLDDDLARETYLEALSAAMYAGRLGEPGRLAEVAQAARAAVGRVPNLHRPIDFLLSGMAGRIIGGQALARSPARRTGAVQRRAQQGDGPPAGCGAFPILQESAAHELWDDAIAQQLATDMVRRARDAGALAVLPPALAYRAGAHMFAGEFATAARLIEEANSITAATDITRRCRYHSLHLAAWRGDSRRRGHLIEAAAADGNARGEGRVLGLTGFATAVLYNGLGRYEEAFAAAREACEYEDLGFYGWCLFELIEAAARSRRAGSVGVGLASIRGTRGRQRN